MCLEAEALHHDLAVSRAIAAAAAEAVAAAHPGALASFDDESVLGIVAVACAKGRDARPAGLEHGVLL